MFWGSITPTALTGIMPSVRAVQKSNMAAIKPEVLISLYMSITSVVLYADCLPSFVRELQAVRVTV